MLWTTSGARSHRRLVENKQPRSRHQGASDRGHLLFAAGSEAGLCLSLFLQARKVAIDTFEVGGGFATTGAAAQGAGDEILLDRQRAESNDVLQAPGRVLAGPDSDGFARCTSMPSKRISPLVMAPRSAGSRLEIAFSVVVLPAPLAPSSARISPGAKPQADVMQRDDRMIVHRFDGRDCRAAIPVQT